MSEWISVNDRLPEKEEKVLVLFSRYSERDILLAKFSRFNNAFTSIGYYGSTVMSVTHWMPLPTPPEV